MSPTRGRSRPRWLSITGLRGTVEPLMCQRTGDLLQCALSSRQSFTRPRFGLMVNLSGNTGARAIPRSRSTSHICSIGEKQTQLPFVWTMRSMNSEKLFNLALAAPRTKFIYAHLGGMNFRFWNVIRAARTAKGLYADNIYFDISGTTVLLKDAPIRHEFVWTIRGVGVDHVLLGSDFPQFTLAETLAAFEELNLTAEEKNKIRYQNARTLFGRTP